MVPKPVAAVLLLFPVTEATEAARKAEQGACASIAFLPAGMRSCWLAADGFQCV